MTLRAVAFSRSVSKGQSRGRSVVSCRVSLFTVNRAPPCSAPAGRRLSEESFQM